MTVLLSVHNLDGNMVLVEDRETKKYDEMRRFGGFIYETHPWQQSSWGQHGAQLGPVGPRWAPCWPHELCYLGHCTLGITAGHHCNALFREGPVMQRGFTYSYHHHSTSRTWPLAMQIRLRQWYNHHSISRTWHSRCDTKSTGVICEAVGINVL